MLQFVTTNAGKLREARAYLDAPVEQFDYDYAELQAPELAPIAAAGAREAHEAAGGPVLVDDAGLFVAALDGFPGPYSAYVENTIGIEQVWELTEPRDDRAAQFRCVVAYCDGGPVDGDGTGSDDGPAGVALGDPDGEPPVWLFEGVVEGELVAPRGEGGFGYDPIFEHEGETYAEMSPEVKNEVSHRGRALARFADWYGAVDR